MIYGNDLATDLNPARGASRVSIGLILQGQGDDEAVVAFRGTEGVKEWVQDAHFGDTAFLAVSDSGRAEDGFTAMYESAKVGDGPEAKSVVSALAGVAWQRPVTSLIVCGHSLGGSLATLFTLDVASNGAAPFRNPTVYTYASPRTGNPDFVAKYTEKIATTHRFVDNVDLVPKLPAPRPYKHVCAETGMDSLTLIPPRVRLQPNPVCWHIRSSYRYLMSLYSGGPKIPPEAECEPSPAALVRHILEQVEGKLTDEKSIRDEFQQSPRKFMGGS